MTSMDKDGDGQISYDEFIAAAINKVALLNENNIKSAFEMIDLDGNGQLTIEELKTAFEVDSTDGASGDLWTDIIKEVDKDGDGQISYKEF
jgi:calcium-dependent protein kinase